MEILACKLAVLSYNWARWRVRSRSWNNHAYLWKLPWIFPGAPLNSNGAPGNTQSSLALNRVDIVITNKQRVLMHGHQGWNVRHGLCHIYMIYVYIWVVYSFCLFCCLFIIVMTQFVALYKPCKPKPKPEPKQQICHQHANTDHFGK